MKLQVPPPSKAVSIVGVLLLTAGLMTPRQAEAGQVLVDLELSLLVDVSGSVDSSEFNLQKQGYADAFRDSSIQTLIANSTRGIAVNFVYWSTYNQQSQVVGWTLLQTAADADHFADLIAATNRTSSGNTSISGAIDFGRTSINSNNYLGSRKVMDISGDGTNNSTAAGRTLAVTRAEALSDGITINGLAITTDDADLDDYYLNNVIGGTDSFVTKATSFEDFKDAVKKKIFFEIQASAVPEPSTVVSGGMACVIGLGLAWRRRRASAA